MDDKIKKEIESLVKNIFSEKEETDMRKRTEDALNASASTIDELTKSLTIEKEKVVDLEDTLVASEEKISTTESELEAAKEEVVGVKKDLEKAEKEVCDMKKDKSMEVRMSDLEKAGVVRADKNAQSQKVRDMTEEEFDAYKDELVSVRESVMAELKEIEEAEATKKEKELKAKKETEGKEDASEDEDEDGSVSTSPANIDQGKAVSAALNMEVSPSSDIVEQYSKLGEAMASMFKKED